MKKVNMTVRQFARSLGLKKTGIDYIGTTVLLKVLVKKGIAKKVDLVHTGKKVGRKSVVYSIPSSFKIEAA
jgi:hypothetical protein